jgi:hypothetical protein
MVAKKQVVGLEAHWRTLAITLILGLLSWQAVRVVEGQERLIIKLNELNVSMAEVKVKLSNVNALVTEVKSIEHRLTILETRLHKHEQGDL